MICPSCGNCCDYGVQCCPYCGCTFCYPPVVQQSPQPIKHRNSAAVLRLGIMSLVLCAGVGCCLGCVGTLFGYIFALSGIIWGFINRKTYLPGEKDVINDTGLILCFIAVGLGLVFAIISPMLWNYFL